jgi:uncharacterized protein (DUF486 family)
MFQEINFQKENCQFIMRLLISYGIQYHTPCIQVQYPRSQHYILAVVTLQQENDAHTASDLLFIWYIDFPIKVNIL